MNGDEQMTAEDAAYAEAAHQDDLAAARRDVDAGDLERAREAWWTDLGSDVWALMKEPEAFARHAVLGAADRGFAAGWAARAAAPPAGDGALREALRRYASWEPTRLIGGRAQTIAWQSWALDLIDTLHEVAATPPPTASGGE